MFVLDLAKLMVGTVLVEPIEPSVEFIVFGFHVFIFSPIYHLYYAYRWFDPGSPTRTVPEFFSSGDEGEQHIFLVVRSQHII